MYRIGFIVEQALGHTTHGQNLLSAISDEPMIETYWGLPGWTDRGLLGRIPNWTIQAGLQTRRMLSSMQKRFRLDALFFHTQVTAVLSPDWLHQIPSVVSLDATPLQYDRLGEQYNHQAGRPWLESWKWRLNQHCFQAARHLVTWSDWTRDSLIREYDVPAHKITVIPPGVQISLWQPPTVRPDRATEPVRILFVGGDLMRKGGVLLLAAFRKLREQLQHQPTAPAVELHLVTRDEVLPQPNVIVYRDIQPNSDRLRHLFHNSDIFCLPTFGDCLPLVLSEAGAACLPMVATHVGAIPELVRPDDTGFLIPPGDEDALVAALQQLVLRPQLRRQMGANAARLVGKSHNLHKNTGQLIHLLMQIVDTTKQGAKA